VQFSSSFRRWKELYKAVTLPSADGIRGDTPEGSFGKPDCSAEPTNNLGAHCHNHR
jgi:hypothetical protein